VDVVVVDVVVVDVVVVDEIVVDVIVVDIVVMELVEEVLVVVDRLVVELIVVELVVVELVVVVVSTHFSSWRNPSMHIMLPSARYPEKQIGSQLVPDSSTFLQLPGSEFGGLLKLHVRLVRQTSFK